MMPTTMMTMMMLASRCWGVLKLNSRFQSGTEVGLKIPTWNWSGIQDCNLELKWNSRLQFGTEVERNILIWN